MGSISRLERKASCGAGAVPGEFRYDKILSMNRIALRRLVGTVLGLALAILALAPLAVPAAADDAATVKKVRDLVQKAHRHFQDGDFKRAAKLYSRADEMAGGRAVAALNGLTQVSLELGDHATAADAAGRWRDAASSAESRAAAMYFQGVAYFQQATASRLGATDAAEDGNSGGSAESSGAPPAGESLERAVQSLSASLGASETAETRPLAALRLADAHTDLSQMDQARAALETYAATGGSDTYAEDLRCFLDALDGAPALRLAADPEPEPGTMPAQLIEAPPIDWPEERPRSVEGQIVLELAISAEGAVECVRVLSHVPHGFTEAAVAAARQARYEPARVDEEAVPWRAAFGIAVSLQTRPNDTRSPFGLAPPGG